MKRCPHCAEEIQDEAVKCKHCGGAVVSEVWRDFCERYAKMTPQERKSEFAALADDQKEVFRAAWSALGYDQPQPAAQPAEAQPSAGGNVIAAVASFLIPGLGQLAQGRIGAALALFLISGILWFLYLGWIGHIAAAIDAAVWKG